MGRRVWGLIAGFALALAVAPSAMAAPKPAGLAYLTLSRGGLTVWVAAANGKHAHRLGSGLQPALAPNGQLVAFDSTVSTRSGVLIFSTITRKQVGAFVKAPVSAQVVWSRDSRYVAVPESSSLIVIDTKKKTTRRLASGAIQGASFGPDKQDSLVYARSKSLATTSPVNLFRVRPNGTHRKQLTTDGKSANPIWGKLGIAFDRITLRGPGEAPAVQIWLMNGSTVTQITNMAVPALDQGLVPVAVSADGSKLVAGFQGEDTNLPWAVDLASHASRQLSDSAVPSGISRDGKRALVALGAFGVPLQSGQVATIPFGGGSPTVLVRHAADPSWNQ